MSSSFLSRLTGSFAMPAAENPTVAMMEAAFRHHDLNWRYVNCEVAADRLGDAVRGARAMNWIGFNCSIPHKVAVIDHLDTLGMSARIIGAVNTVMRKGERLVGENTDGKGFVQAIRAVTELKGKMAVIFGAGGAARAIAVEMALAGIENILVVNRNAERGHALVDTLANETACTASYREWTNAFFVPTETDIAINATPINLHPRTDQRLDVDMESLKPHMLVVDCIPNPPRTNWLHDAQLRGCTTLDGLGMLVNQGAIAFGYWTGTEPDRAVMRHALERALRLS